jgi:hypothetical protein
MSRLVVGRARDHIVPEPITFHILHLSEVLDDDDQDRLVSMSEFTWGDTDVVLVNLATFIEVCDKRGLTLAPGVRECQANRPVSLAGITATIYVDLTD